MKIKKILSDFSEVFNSEKSNIDDIIDVLFKSSKILKELKAQFDQYKSNHLKSVVLSGLTGAGKTTLSHYLEGNELEYRKLEDKSKKLFVSNEKSIGREIGHSSLSTTFFPNVFMIKDLPDHQIIELVYGIIMVFLYKLQIRGF
jgi:2-hydroxy-3-keto-5-methylthiopentenyl-1-phosphate phosphatase